MASNTTDIDIVSEVYNSDGEGLAIKGPAVVTFVLRLSDPARGTVACKIKCGPTDVAPIEITLPFSGQLYLQRDQQLVLETGSAYISAYRFV